MVPVVSDRIPRVPPYSGYRYILQTLHVRDYHPLRSNFPIDSISFCMIMSRSYNPILPKQHWFGLFPFHSPLLRESIFLSFPAGTKMFQFPALTHLTVWLAFNQPGCPIRIFTDQISFADPRNFSQLTTSFFAHRSLGILRSPLSNFSLLEIVVP